MEEHIFLLFNPFGLSSTTIEHSESIWIVFRHSRTQWVHLHCLSSFAMECNGLKRRPYALFLTGSLMGIIHQKSSFMCLHYITLSKTLGVGSLTFPILQWNSFVLYAPWGEHETSYGWGYDPSSCKQKNIVHIYDFMSLKCLTNCIRLIFFGETMLNPLVN